MSSLDFKTSSRARNSLTHIPLRMSSLHFFGALWSLHKIVRVSRSLCTIFTILLTSGKSCHAEMHHSAESLKNERGLIRLNISESNFEFRKVTQSACYVVNKDTRFYLILGTPKIMWCHQNTYKVPENSIPILQKWRRIPFL